MKRSDVKRQVNDIWQRIFEVIENNGREILFLAIVRFIKILKYLCFDTNNPQYNAIGLEDVLPISFLAEAY